MAKTMIMGAYEIKFEVLGIDYFNLALAWKMREHNVDLDGLINMTPSGRSYYTYVVDLIEELWIASYEL